MPFSRRPRIRFAASLLAVVLLAAALLVGGYCGLLAWRRPAPPPADAPPPPTTAALPVPTRLGTGPDFGGVALAAADKAGAARIAVTVRVHGLAAAWRTADAGIAIAPVDGSDSPQWLPLAAASATDDALALACTLARAGDVTIALASNAECAAHGYLVRKTVAVRAAGPIEFDGSASQVHFRLPAGSQHSCPVRIVRSDDPAWLPMHVAPSGLLVARETATAVWLGHGSYELCDPLQPDQRQPFAVPANLDVTLTCVQPARAGHR